MRPRPQRRRRGEPSRRRRRARGDRAPGGRGVGLRGVRRSARLRAADLSGPTIILGAAPSPNTQQEIQNIEASIGRPLGSAYGSTTVGTQPSQPHWICGCAILAIRSSSRWPPVTGTARPCCGGTSPTHPRDQPIYNDLVSWARRIRDYGAPLVLPVLARTRDDAERRSGDEHRLHRCLAAGLEHLPGRGGGRTRQFVWTLTDEAFWIAGEHAATNWYPGDAYVDAIGADAYNWHNCKAGFPNGPWKSFFDVVNPLRLFGQNHPTIPLMLPEFGTVEDPSMPGRKAQWFNDARALLKSPGWESFRAALYFNHRRLGEPRLQFPDQLERLVLDGLRRDGSRPVLLRGGLAAQRHHSAHGARSADRRSERSGIDRPLVVGGDRPRRRDPHLSRLPRRRSDTGGERRECRPERVLHRHGPRAREHAHLRRRRRATR